MSKHHGGRGDYRNFSDRYRRPTDNRTTEDIGSDLWIHRDVVGSSIDDFRSVSTLLGLRSKKAKMGGYTLTLLYGSEILTAQRLSRHAYISDRRLGQALEPFLPSSLKKPIDNVHIEGLDQYGEWIGATILSPELESERAVILSGLNSVFGIEHDWSTQNHISLARGNLARVQNTTKILSILPTEVGLSPGKAGFIERP